MISIVTLNWDHYDDLTGPFIRYIDTYVPNPKQLIVVDQGSKEGDKKSLTDDAQRFDWLKIILLDQNTGFPRGNNIGTEYAEGDYIVWMNNDIIISGEWWEEVQAELDKSSKNVVGMSLVELGGWNEFDVEIDPQVAHEHHLQGGGTDRWAIPYLEGWLIAVNKRFLTEVGTFDEQFGVGSLEDVDLCHRAAIMGYNFVSIPSLPIQHLRGMTVMDGRLKQVDETKNNYELMKTKLKKELGCAL